MAISRERKSASIVDSQHGIFARNYSEFFSAQKRQPMSAFTFDLLRHAGRVKGGTPGRAACRGYDDDGLAGGFMSGHGQVAAPASLIVISSILV